MEKQGTTHPSPLPSILANLCAALFMLFRYFGPRIERKEEPDERQQRYFQVRHTSFHSRKVQKATVRASER